MGLGKVLILVGIILLAVWYFQPDTFASYKNKALGLFGSSNDNSISDNSDYPETIQTITHITEQPSQDTEEPQELIEGYCIIDGTCVYSAAEDCATELYNSISLCEDNLSITPTQNDTRTYIGKPTDAYNNEYDCRTDINCRYDNINCKDVLCQCNYVTGECYIG